jgi:site-specific DNA-cytosine methylase
VRHASFFSGVGGLDLGFERAGIKTVSVSEIDPYASAVLAERFPDAPNLGNITEVSAHDIPEADIFSGGFPCQDLSVAGKRAGFAGKRSSLAFTYLDLVEQRRPRWIVLENVPGLFTSNHGADFGRLLYEMEQLGYGVSWRVLDARFFGVAQRRRRVFIVGSLESDRSAEVLVECQGCDRHPAPRRSSGEDPASSPTSGAGADRSWGRYQPASATADADGVREADGVPRRVDGHPIVDTFGAETHRALQARDWKVGVSNQDIGQQGFLVGYQTRVDETGGSFTLNEVEIANSLSALWPSDTSHRSMTLVHGSQPVLSFPSRFGSNASVTEGQAQSMAHSAGAPAVLLDSQAGTHVEDDLEPVGLDSHRYRCCGNGVVAPVAEWIGRRIVDADRRWREQGT